MRQDLNAPPLNPLPPVVWILALPIIAMEVVLAVGEGGLAGGPAAVGWRLDALQRFAVSPELARWMVENAVWPPEALLRFLAYPFVQGSTTQAIFVVVILLALGKMVGEIFRWWAVMFVFFASSIVGAVVYCAVPAIEAPLFGGYPGNYGLIGAFTFLLWVRLAGSGATQYRAFSMIGFLMGVQLLFSLLFGTGPQWFAELVAFFVGFGLSFVVSPGGFARVRARLRER